MYIVDQYLNFIYFLHFWKLFFFFKPNCVCEHNQMNSDVSEYLMLHKLVEFSNLQLLIQRTNYLFFMFPYICFLYFFIKNKWICQIEK